VRADHVVWDDALSCHACGCRFTLPPFGLGPFAHWADDDRVIEHGSRWRRVVVRPHANLIWGQGSIGPGWERLYPGLDLNIGLGPLSLHLYVGPGVR
jgi:hypothetical protein